ncbi:MAG: DedA family protein [Leptospiraceae bacterium]|nr:DedA family protein [Leptospiraceae bacterium]MCK6381131.1 DedA family protein [Leptospiraceae bacterium]NUM40579.1 DedA family protein [Leptospiraceae bacterium]
MEFITNIIDFILHIDKHLDYITQEFGLLTYLILFLIIFAETGLVVTPFLPGDSLLFAIGAIAARGSLSLTIIIITLIIAAIIGDTVNYWVGRYFRPKILSGHNIRFINKKHLDKTHEFYEKYGGKTIIIGRFIPIVRTFAPFVAGIGEMTYSKFILYNIVGGIIWILIFTVAGFVFGNIPLIRKNFTLVVFAIIFLSILPAIIEFIKIRYFQKK